MKMFRVRVFSLSICAAALLLAQPALSQSASTFDAPIPLTDEELADMRGGFLTAGGVVFDFGAIVRTYVGGALALETRLTWTPSGPVTTQVTGALPGWASLADGAAAAQAGGLDLTGLPPGSSGLVLTDANGSTALIHNVMNGQLQNMVLNAANNRDIHQDMQVMLTLPNFDAMQRDFSLSRLGSQISGDLDWGSVQGVGR
ncbi:hypothetical protein [Brevundimonas sp.]|uniref:hypothetical protein n=1 Tax=Brevundimonas sp. TaxID=1871086 RepID=UPI003D6D9057